MMASPQINGTLLKSAWCYHEPFNIKIGNACCSSSDPRNVDRSKRTLSWSYHSYQLMMNIDPSESKLCSCKLEYKQQNRQLLTTWTKKSDKNILGERLMTHPKINFLPTLIKLRHSRTWRIPMNEECMLNYSYKFWSPIPYHENMKAWMFSSDTIVLPASWEGQ